MKKLFGLLTVLTIFGIDLFLNPNSAWGNLVPATPPTPPTPPVIEECNLEGNLISNYNFNCGKDNWNFHQGDWRNKFEVLDVSNYGKVGYVKVGRLVDNIQLYQKDIELKPSTQYELSFDAKANRNRKLPVYLHKHSDPYTNYGIDGYKFDLTTSWNNYSLTFTTTGFATEVNDARLRFWFKNFSQIDDEIWIDNVVIKEI